MDRKQKKGTVAIAGYYGFGNAGDELVLLALIQQLRRARHDVPITVFSARPHQTAEHFGVKAVSRWKPWSWVAALWHAEIFILGGGGLLQESTGVWNHIYYLSLLSLAKVLRCRTEVRALGVDPIMHWWNRIWTRFVFDYLVDYVSVRDTESQRALETTGVVRRLWRVPDLVFNLDRPKARPPAQSPARIAWAMTAWPQRPGWEHDLAAIMDRTAKQLGAKNEIVVFFPAQDEALARRVAEIATQPVDLRTWGEPEELIGAMQDYSLTIGMRYHALALAALAERPFIGWGFQRKVRTLCRDFNQPMWTFERGWDPESVFRQVAEAWKRREAVSERYKAQLDHVIGAPAEASESARIFVASV
jgi:polysaccharide pyruvyl transferase CsaB